MDIVKAILSEGETLPPISAWYEYVVGANGLFIRAEDSRIEACVPVADVATKLRGLVDVQPYARLKIPHVSSAMQWSVLESARRHLPNEAMYQLRHSGLGWNCHMPRQQGTPTALAFEDDGEAVIDVHSHNTMAAFFSSVDDADEAGLRFYAVVGRVDTLRPEIRVRVGVYGHHWDVPASLVFESGPFTDRYGCEEDDETLVN